MVTNHLTFSKDEKYNVITALINAKIFLQNINKLFNMAIMPKNIKNVLRPL